MKLMKDDDDDAQSCRRRRQHGKYRLSYIVNEDLVSVLALTMIPR